MNRDIIGELNVIKGKLYNKDIDYTEAKKLANPLIKLFNKISREIAEKHNQKPRYISFAGFMR